MGRRGGVSVHCTFAGCRESGFYECSTARERDEVYRSGKTWRCVRHAQPDEVLSGTAPERVRVLVASRLHGLDHLYWIAEGSETGNGFAHGPGFKAYANDFPEGTRLIVTARVESPAGRDALAATKGKEGESNA